MTCKWCKEGSVRLAVVERPGSEPGVDEITTDAWLIQPDMYDDDIGLDSPSIKVSVLAAQTACLTPDLIIPVRYCPMCGRELANDGIFNFEV